MTRFGQAPLRVVVTGSECTGKTTLAQAIAERFVAPWVPESSRLHAEEVALREHRELTLADVQPIARRHLAAEDEALTRAGPLLILDTDLLSTVVYSRHYYGECAAWIEAAARERLADLYLFCRPDLPWIADGVRDRPIQREQIDALFRSRLDAVGARCVEVVGQGRERTEIGERAVARLLAEAR
ncbi:MAG: ATP-binding protein [Acidobacteriota bacterium]